VVVTISSAMLAIAALSPATRVSHARGAKDEPVRVAALRRSRRRGRHADAMAPPPSLDIDVTPADETRR